MPTPAEHALLSASAAHRWMVCTAAPLFEEQFPASTSPYAEEGTLAHSVCELTARKYFTAMPTRKYNAELAALKEKPRWKDEMLHTADAYVQYLKEKSFSFEQMPHVAFETRVDLREWIPEGFGTCDCIMIGGDTLHITDYKHGQGVAVSAIGNPQMRLYALGALSHYRPVFGARIKRISMAIVQPRITEEVKEDVMTVEELLDWGAEVKTIAEKAHSGKGEFVPGEHCKFCRGKNVCRARALQNTALEEFKNCVTPAKANGVNPILTDAEIGDLITRGAFLVDWYNDLRDYALAAILDGKTIPGYKVVEGRSNRAFSDADAAINRMVKAGYDKAILFDYKAKSLSELEKITGKKAFAELMKDLIVKPAGKPTLVKETDARSDYSSAAVDFGGIV